MGLFKDMLGGGESLFKNEEALDLDFVPKLLPFRDQQQHHVARCIKPLLEGRNGTNMFIHGAPGIGKTAAIKWVFRDLADTTDDVHVVYVNCWQRNTSYQVLLGICDELGYAFTQNKRQDELMEIIKGMCNKKAVVFCFDEIDKVEDLDFLYSILQDIFKRSVILITNYKEWLGDMEQRVKSRFLPDVIEFKPYNRDETKKILQDRVGFAFVPGCWNAEALDIIVDKAAHAQDIRSGIFLMRQAALAAENASSRKIMPEHAQSAVAKLSDMLVQRTDDLEDDTKLVLDVIKAAGGGKSGDLFKVYKEKSGEGSYKTFARKVEKLAKAVLIKTNKIVGGPEGTTTLITLSSSKNLADF